MKTPIETLDQDAGAAAWLDSASFLVAISFSRNVYASVKVLMSFGSRGSTMKRTGMRLDSPAFSNCSVKQKHSVLLKYNEAEFGATLGTALWSAPIFLLLIKPLCLKWPYTSMPLSTIWPAMTRRLIQLFLGLALYGFSIGVMVRSGLGLDPWDVFHQGLSNHIGLSFGMTVNVVGLIVLLLWIPIRQRPGIGTVANVLLIGTFADLSLWLLPEAPSLPVAAAMLLSSAYGFNRDDAKTADHFFTGFPSYWNIVVAYMWLAEWSPVVNAVILTVLAVLVFVPIRYAYPSRMPVMRASTNALAALWGAAVVMMLWRYPDVPPALLYGSLAFPFYYLALSLYLQFGRAARR